MSIVRARHALCGKEKGRICGLSPVLVPHARRLGLVLHHLFRAFKERLHAANA